MNIIFAPEMNFIFQHVSNFHVYHCSGGKMLRAKIKQHCPPFPSLKYLRKGKRQEINLFFFFFLVGDSMTPPKGPKAGELFKKKAVPLLAPVSPELLGKVTQQVSPSLGAQGAWSPTTSLPAAAA